MRAGVRRALAAFAATLLMALAGLIGPARAETLSLTLPQAQDLARQALASGDIALAQAIARRLLEADPRDARALLIIAATAPLLGQPAEGRRAGRAAWIAARKAPLLRYEIARFTARAALVEGRKGSAQFWLRRAVDVAPDQASATRTANDFADLRATRVLSYRLDLSVSPSSNLNGGATGDALTVNGTVPLGTLSGSARALEGTRAAAQVQLAWKLPDRPRLRAKLGLRAYATANFLTASAQAQAPDLQGSDLNLIVIEANATTDWVPAGLDRPLHLVFGTGRTWSGGNALGPHLRAEAGIGLIARPDLVLRTSLSYERQWRSAGTINATVLRLEGSRALQGGARLSSSIAIKNVVGPDANTTYRAASLDIGLDLARPVGPALLSLRANIGAVDYPFYTLGIFGVTDGREDVSAGLSLEAAFPSLARYGYMPRLTLEAQTTQSNISRFESRSLGLSFGVLSQF